MFEIRNRSEFLISLEALTMDKGLELFEVILPVFGLALAPLKDGFRDCRQFLIYHFDPEIIN